MSGDQETIILRAIAAIEKNVDRMVDSILEVTRFMGESSKDRENIHVRLDKHDERITSLENDPKKKAQSH